MTILKDNYTTKKKGLLGFGTDFGRIYFFFDLNLTFGLFDSHMILLFNLLLYARPLMKL